MPEAAPAANGDLTYVGCFGHSSAFGCTHAPPGVGAAPTLQKAIVAPDGLNAYAIGSDPFAQDPGGLMRLGRSADGGLSFVSCFVGPPCRQFPPGTNPVDHPQDIAASPDGRDLYVTSTYGAGIAHFRIDAGGDPAYVDCVHCYPDPGLPASMFGRVEAIAISPDGKNVYAGTFGGGLFVFDREDSGTLYFASCWGWATACDHLPDTCPIPLSDSCRADALSHPRSIAVSPSGRTVFVASAAGAEFYGESISRYRRESSGKLAFMGCFGYATAGCHSTAAWPIVGAEAIQAGPSDNDVYVAARAYSDAGPRDVVSHLVVGTDGRLRLADCIAEQAVSGCSRVPAGISALSFSRSAAISPDGQSLYVEAVGVPAVTHLRIGAGGRLSFGGCWGGGGCTGTVLPAGNSQALSVSPDGRNVYAAADNRVVVLRREQGPAPPAPLPPPAPAPAVRTAEADGVGPGAAILTARINPLASETTYAFEVGQTTAYGTTSPVAPAGGGSDVRWLSTRVSGLVPGTTYHYRAVAKSAAGSAWGKDATFMTAPAASDPPPGLAPIREIGPQDRSVTYQVNPGHSGYLPDNRLVPPLMRRWSRELGGEVSYPVVAEGKVFVMVAADTEPRTRLYALDAHTGGTLWSRGFGIAVLGPVRGLAYDQGKVFAAASRPVGRDGRGQLAAFDADTGEPLWVSYDIGYPRTSLTAAGGVVYGSGEARSGFGGEVFALRESDGGPLWIRGVQNGARSSPALAGNRVLVAYSCHMYAFTLSGGLAWSRNTGCSGAGGSTVIVAPGGRAYVRGLVSPEGAIFAVNSGALIGAFPIDGDYDAPPVFARDVALFVRGDRLVAEELTSGAALWTFDGDGGFGMAPIVAGPIVYIGSRAGTLYGLALKTGRVLWSTNAGSGFLASERPLAGTGTWPGLGAGNGLLVAPAGDRLSAYSPPHRESSEGPGGGGGSPPVGSGSSQAGTTVQPGTGSTTPAIGAAATPSPKVPSGSCSPSRTLRGPVDVTAGIRSGIASLSGDPLRKGRYVHRIRWEVSPRYRHPLTLSARGFAFAQGRSIRVESQDRRGRRRMTTRALLPGPGCYSVGVRGPGLRRRIVFTAR